MLIKENVLKSLQDQYNKALRSLYGESKDMSYDAAEAVLEAIEEIASELGILKEIQSNA